MIGALVRTHKPVRNNRGPLISAEGWKRIGEFCLLAVIMGLCALLGTAGQP